MQVNALNGQNTLAGAGAPVGQGELGKEEFLKLLTVQLSNQDPLNPMENEAFVAQLAQFSSLEQLMGLGEGMQNLATAQAVANGSNMVGMIGREVTYAGSEISHTKSATETLNVELAEPAKRVTVTIHDAEGNVVRTIEAGAQSDGNVQVEWDGKNDQGIALESGEYTYQVSAADADGNPVDATPQMRGIVSGVTYESGYPELIVNGQRIAVGQVISVVDAVQSDGDPTGDPEQVEEAQEQVYVDEDES